ncbi:Uncharacterised protein [Dermatophilus congolensis]|uniref:DUF2993 domain-containing protein n=1 Tax=Dermatophilus congolensis TaxID=1863 RepID=A0AA46H097_9MICO|nr:LmeA family phospholipid-binding protein [Dermatophilus congolensis]STD08066.1 Uncharacterised protein [Dermatophilus congolensis]
MKIATRVLAALGLLFIALTIAAVVAFMTWSRPATSATTTPTAPATPSHLAQGEYSANNLTFATPQLDTSSGTITDVHLTAGNFVNTSKGKRIDNFKANALVPFTTVQNKIGNGVTITPTGDGKITTRTTFEILGRQLTLTGTGTMTVDAGRLVFNPSAIGFHEGPPGLNVPEWAAGRLRFAIPVPALPENATITNITTENTGFRIHLAGSQLQLPS